MCVRARVIIDHVVAFLEWQIPFDQYLSPSFLPDYVFFFQEGFAQPDQENDIDHLDNLNNGNGSNLIGGDDETY